VQPVEVDAGDDPGEAGVGEVRDSVCNDELNIW